MNDDDEVNLLADAFKLAIEKTAPEVPDEVFGKLFGFFMFGAEFALRSMTKQHGPAWRIDDVPDAEAKGFLLLDEIQRYRAASETMQVIDKLGKDDHE